MIESTQAGRSTVVRSCSVCIERVWLRRAEELISKWEREPPHGGAWLCAQTHPTE